MHTIVHLCMRHVAGALRYPAQGDNVTDVIELNEVSEVSEVNKATEVTELTEVTEVTEVTEKVSKTRGGWSASRCVARNHCRLGLHPARPERPAPAPRPPPLSAPPPLHPSLHPSLRPSLLLRSSCVHSPPHPLCTLLLSPPKPWSIRICRMPAYHPSHSL